MRTMNGRVAVAVMALALGCAGGEPPGPAVPGPAGPTGGPPPPAGLEVAIEIASVTLADDCGPPADSGFATPPPAASQERVAAPAAAPPAKMAAGSMSQTRRACQQTTMQLAVTAGATGQPSPIALTQVELFDDQGTSLGTLASRAPKLWADGGYAAWDATVAPGQALKVSYDLSAPDWSRLGGRRATQDRTFTVRVTARVGDRDRTAEKKIVSPAMVPEPVMPPT